MNYPKIPNLKHEVEWLELYSQLKHEYGTRAIEPILRQAHRDLRSAVARLRRLPIDPALARREPNSLAQIQKLRPSGPRRLWPKFDSRAYADRLEGAFLGRMAGCTLGAPVEFWDIEKMQDLARENKVDFPPTDYWTRVPEPFKKRYGLSPRDTYTRDRMDGVPTDDDIVYTLLGLLIVERYGPDFSVADVGKAWLDLLPHACTAEHIALENLKAGVPAAKAGEKNNPYCEWIGADIRADPWGYLAPAWPEKAAEMAWRDATISHRRNGIYGEMYFAAAIAAAFAVADPVEALIIGLSEIPIDCAFSQGVRWALEVAPEIRDYRQARDAVEKRFVGMHRVHAINNACLTIFGITIGGTDLSRVIGETVAMGMDNDCTAATAGSIVGAVVGKTGIPARWTRRFNNKVHSYLIKNPVFRIDDLLKRFARQACRVLGP